MSNSLPEKPDKQKEQIGMLWDACFNHIPTQLSWLNIKVNFILAIMGVILTLVAISIVIALNAT